MTACLAKLVLNSVFGKMDSLMQLPHWASENKCDTLIYFPSFEVNSFLCSAQFSFSSVCLLVTEFVHDLWSRDCFSQSVAFIVSSRWNNVIASDQLDLG